MKLPRFASVLLAGLQLVGCGAGSASAVAVGEEDVAQAAGPEVRVRGASEIVADGLPAAAADGTVAVLTATTTDAGTTYTFELRSAEDWRQFPLVVATSDGTLLVQEDEVKAANRELSAKTFISFNPAAADATGIASSNGHEVSIAGTDLRRAKGDDVTLTSLADEVAELNSIDACAYEPKLVEAFASEERNLFYARISYVGDGCPGGQSIWALPFAPATSE